MNNLPKRIHIVGICGVATSALAIAFHERGVEVTGSDKGFYPPVSTELEKRGIKFYAGWHPEKMVEGSAPDIVVAGGVGTSPSNPEIVYSKEHGIPLLSFAEALAKYVVRKNSIVTAGTWGKTTSSAMLSFILDEAGWNPSYFTGGLSMSHPTGKITDSEWSVVEGDEYQIAIYDKRPKFDLYSPTHLLLTSVSWDHADLYPTEKEYFAAFERLVGQVPNSGIIVACADDEGAKRVIGKSKARVITYGESPSADFRLHSIEHTRTGLKFRVDHRKSLDRAADENIGNRDDTNQRNASYEIESPMLGRFNAENIAGVFAMAISIGIDPEKVIGAVKKFKGIKRRFEKRLDSDITVLDCHAPTPEKAASVLESVREVYDTKIIAVYEPNIGGRQRSSAAAYDNAFKNADMVVISRLTKLKVAENESEQPIEGEELARIIGRTHTGVNYIESDEKTVTFLKSQTTKGDVIVFLGSHGWRGMIEETIKAVS